MNTKDVDDYFMSNKVPEPPPEQAPAPVKEPLPQKTNGHKRERTIPDLTLDVGMPANVDAERTILGAILLDNAAFTEAGKSLESEDFSLDSHRRIFLRMAELMDSQHAVDIVTLSHCLAQHKEVESIGGVAYLASLTEGLPRRPVID